MRLPLALAALGTDSHVVSRPEFPFKMGAERIVSIDPTNSPLRKSGGAARADFAPPGALGLNDYGAKGDGVTDDCSAFTAAEHATLPAGEGRPT
jgi:hypothetical protein